ncbi:uncharacterized protein ccdc92ba [Gasterosteus aculeatus]
MADESRLSQQIGSVERSVVFLRQEHLTLLHGLHLEILSLQKRCSELTSDLKVKPPGRSQIELQEEEELLEDRCWDAEGRLAEQECSIGELRVELTHKGALVGALRANLKEKERHFLEELKRRSHCSTILNTELQKQTEAAAYLSFQLHAARQKLHHQRMQQRQGLLARGHSQGGAHYGAEQNSVPPQPPSGGAPSSPAVKPKRKGARASSRAERARECVPLEKVTGPAEPTAMPDPALFLHPRRHRARSRHTAAQRQPPPGPEKGDEEEEEEGEREGGEGPVQPLGARARLMSAGATAAETKAE